jgi:catechol 2,3-dioxygenase-like lactoylglutathione lyase family enzyme
VLLAAEELHDLEVVEDLGDELVDSAAVWVDLECDVVFPCHAAMLRRSARRGYRAGTGVRSGLTPVPLAGAARSATLCAMSDDSVWIRYIVDDVAEAVDFYTRHFGFELGFDASPAVAEVRRGSLRLLLSGPPSSAQRALPDGRQPEPGGWNRLHFHVDDIAGEVDRLRAEGVGFRSDVIKGPGGQQIVLDDPSGNPVELFQPSD